MRIRDYTKSHMVQFVTCFIVLIGLDQLIKSSSSLLTTNSFLGFSIEKVFNPGFIFSIRLNNSFMPESFISILIVSAFIMIYFILLHFLPKNFLQTRWGLTLIFSGFFSNIIDKILHSQVVDFLKFKFMDKIYYINFADIIQTIGWIVVFHEIFTERSFIWRKLEQRKAFIVLKKYQYEFIIYVLWIVGCAFLLTTLLGLEYLRRISATPPEAHQEIINSFPIYALWLFSIFLIPISLVTIYFSNKIYGPVYAFEKYVKAIVKGESVPDLKLRDKDQFKNLEKLSQEIKKKIQKNN